MLLEGKVAVIYGAGGNIAGAVARAYADEGARLYLAGHHADEAKDLAKKTRGKAEVIDALDEAAIDAWTDMVANEAGRIDVSFNLIGIHDVQQALMKIGVDDFLQPIVNAMRSQFLTTRAAARHMIRQKSGVILMFGGGGPQTVPNLGGFKVALDAMEGLRRQWAIELGPHQIRILTLKTGGVADAIPDDFEGRDELIEHLKAPSPMKRIAGFEDVGHVAVFAASDHARSITDTWINMGFGSMPE
jgi:3-oxoacyl-[acyl-carrier protein] reductase